MFDKRIQLAPPNPVRTHQSSRTEKGCLQPFFIKIKFFQVLQNLNFMTNLSLAFIAYNLLFPFYFIIIALSIHCNLMSIISMQLFFIFIAFRFHVFIQCNLLSVPIVQITMYCMTSM